MVRILFALLWVASGLAQEAAVPPGITGWPLFRGDGNSTGVSVDLIAPPMELAWAVETAGPVPATAVIDRGRVFVGSLGGEFLCLDLVTGRKIWSFVTKLGVEGAACLAGDLVFLGETEGFVRALRAEDGTEVWKYETGDAIVGGLNRYRTKAGRDLILAGSDDFFLHAVDAVTGEKVWAVETGNYVKGAPSVDQASGLVIFGGCDERLRLIDAETGELAREIEVGAYMGNSCAVRDRIAYVAHYAGQVLAFDLVKGETAWSHDAEGTEFVSSPAVDVDIVVVGGRDKKLRALARQSGELKWEFLARRGIDSSPVLTPEFVVVGADDGRIYVLDRQTGEERWAYEIGARINSSPAIGEGHVVIGAQDGSVYAFRAEKRP